MTGVGVNMNLQMRKRPSESNSSPTPQSGLVSPEFASGTLLTRTRHIRDRPARLIEESLIMFRLTSGCQHQMRGVGAAVLILRKCSDAPLTYRRVGLRTLKNHIFEDAAQVEVRIE